MSQTSPKRLRLGRLRWIMRVRDPRRRYNCQDQESPDWEDRAVAAVALLAASPVSPGPGAHLQVGDFGAGNTRLRRIMEQQFAASFDYHPYDLNPQAKDVHRIDLQRELPGRIFDVVFCLGLLEYLDDVEKFVGRLRTATRAAIISYVVADAAGTVPSPERRKRGWINDFARRDLERFFERCGFTRQGFCWVDDGLTGIWLWVAE